jgi:hypothetical protein
MVGSRFLAALFVIGASSLGGQQRPLTAQTVPSAQASPLSPAEAKKLALDIGAAYYGRRQFGS